MNKLLIGILILIVLISIADIFFFKIILGCTPKGQSGNYFRNDRCCFGSQVKMSEVFAVTNGSFTCE